MFVASGGGIIRVFRRSIIQQCRSQRIGTGLRQVEQINLLGSRRHVGVSIRDDGAVVDGG